MKPFFLLPGFTFLICLTVSCKKHDTTPQTSTPVIEGVTIGTQTWTKKNLDVDHYKNGDAIPEVKDFAVWKNLKTGAWHYYDNDANNGKIYGKLYNWYAVTDPRGLAPSGCHIPSDAEWSVLTTYLGGESAAGGKIKEAGTSHWISPNTAADNSSGFNALPAGTSTSAIFWQLGYNSYWWSTTSFASGNDTFVYFRAVYNNSGAVNRAATDISGSLSVRCIKD